MHFKYKASVVFQIVFGEFQIRAKGEVNKAQKMKKIKFLFVPYDKDLIKQI